jgi:hypothetical protein
MNDYSAIRRAASSLSVADQLLTSRYRNTAHRSWYWGANLASLSATVTSSKAIEGRIFCSYPGFMRRSSAWVKRTVINRLAETCGCSNKTVREELLPSLVAVQHSKGEDFSLSHALSLSPEEHVAICGLNVSHRSVKSLMEKYSSEMEMISSSIESETITVSEEISEKESQSTGQQTLF